MNFTFTYRSVVKRLLDLVGAASCIVMLSPVLAILASLVRWRLGSFVLFRQLRPGLHGEPFSIYKFRTMRSARDEHGKLLPDGERLSTLGRWLRATSLDELPELWNVLRGDMSLVGPRPLLMEYLERYTPEQARRHEVKPGITGWAQVNGRNAITWEEKFRLDVWYVNHVSFWVDLKILLMSLWKVVRREGISQPGCATTQEFLGPLRKTPDGCRPTPEEENRFAHWTHPVIEDGRLTQYNWLVQHKENLSLGYRTDIGAFTYINAKYGVVIEDLVQIGSHCSIYSVSTIDGKRGPVLLKRNARIGAHTVIMPGVMIGENAVVGAHSFVNKDVPPGEVVAGVPARKIR